MSSTAVPVPAAASVAALACEGSVCAVAGPVPVGLGVSSSVSGGVVGVASRVFTPEDKRDHVIAYVQAPWGSKARYLEEHAISADMMKRWRSALADGDLAAGRVPRHTGEVTTRDVSEIRRLEGRVAALEKERDQALAQAETMRRAADALGKAIGVMEKLHGAACAGDESS